MDIQQYYEKYGTVITQASERLFVEEFLYPLVKDKIGSIIPQYPFLDRTGRSRKIDFACQGSRAPLALEVNGETYHAEGIIPNEMFSDNLFRQNEILRAGYKLARFSYSQLQDPRWRPIVMASIRDIIAETAPELLSRYELTPTALQQEALDALDFYRRTKEWQKGIVVMPTGTGKTILSALDAQRVGGRVLFLVHRLDILHQSVEAYRLAWPTMRHGYLTGDVRKDETTSEVLFASKDTLRQPDELARFDRHAFDYIVIDEVHHGQSPTYRDIIDYFRPRFMLGMTATPDRLDRKDIFELFDFNKAYEIPVHDAIERGFLVPFSYYGLTDNIDYSRIRYENYRYRVDDLERYLIIPERNNAIVREYQEKGGGDKAIGFCVSIRHADRMAEFFNQSGIRAAAIHSQSPDRDQLIEAFRQNQFNVVFTVDLFNEGIDIPNVQVLLFLRPTESKTVFVQQLGRGLRVAAGKERVRVLDFIGNYQRANLIRGYLAKGKREVQVDDDGRRRRKVEYEYSTGCDVHFDAAVEEILDRQDAAQLGVGKLELSQAYSALAEQLGHKPSRTDIDAQGEYKSARYAQVYGSWLNFLREIGEYTEASYHYPQGTHVGHLLSILWFFGLPDRTGTHFDNKYIRIRGGLAAGRLGAYQRQAKYKLLAAMELGILEDDRRAPADGEFIPQLMPLGRELRAALQPSLEDIDLSFPLQDDGVPSTDMVHDEQFFNALVRRRAEENNNAATALRRSILRMPAAVQMLAFLYQVSRQVTVQKAYVYEHFFQAPFVKQFMDQEGIEEATPEASRRRCPFLLNLLASLGIVQLEQRTVTVNNLTLVPALLRPHTREDEETSTKRLRAIAAAWPDRPQQLSPDDLSIARELFGQDFLTDRYVFTSAQFLSEQL